MKKLALILLFGICGIEVYGQTIKTLGYNTTNGQVVYSGTNTLKFTNSPQFSSGAVFGQIGDGLEITTSGLQHTFGFILDAEGNSIVSGNGVLGVAASIEFAGTNAVTYAATTRTNLSLGATWLTNTNASSFRTAIGLGQTNQVYIGSLVLSETDNGIAFDEDSAAAITRTNLGLGWSALTNTNASNFRSAIELGQTNSVTFQKLLLNGTTSASFPLSIGQKQTQGTNERFYGFSWDGQYSGNLTYHHDVASISSEPEVRISSTEITIYSPITFASGSAQTRTNLGLGNGITTNHTFVSYDGTNYTTNSVTISNGIITGWTQ